MKPALVLFLLVNLTMGAYGQVKRHSKKGRRYKSESQFALKKHDFEVEWEFGREIIDSQLSTLVYPDMVLHYAFTDRFEVNTELNLVSFKNQSLESKTSGFEPVLIGANYQVIKDSGYRPSVMISAQLALPFLASHQFAPDHLAPVVQLNIQEAIHDKWLFGAGGGLLWDGFSTAPNFIYNVSTSYSITKKWMFTAECFGFINHNLPQNSMDVSVAYVINDLVQFGITAGAGLSVAAPKHYFAVNGTWGLNTARKKTHP